ncbi:MAG: NUDIX domain-containing protein [Pseudomonadales bacterium]|nr:NUDIX domain-containing protein [Pseudomonadales bacterium]
MTLTSPILNTTWQPEWQPEFIGTLLFIVEGERILLIHKKTGHGAGKVNGPGGKLQSGESVVECALRETEEEVGLCALDAECVLEMRFVEQEGQQWLGYACLATQYVGELTETPEAKPFWCAIDAIPYDQMWPDDKIWLPQILKRDPQTPRVADFLFRAGSLLEYRWRDSPDIAGTF